MTGYEKMKELYEKFEDKISQDIFLNRLLFSLSGDENYIKKMVRSERKRYGSDDVMTRLLEWTDIKNKPLTIFGAGFAGVQIANVLLFEGREVKRFVDNNRRLWGKKQCGLEVCNPAVLSETEEFPVVIGTNSCVAEIKKQLLGMNVAEDGIFVPDKSWWMGRYPQYFDREIMKPHRNESFVDGGSLDGGDSREFIKWCNGDYDAVYMFEPDADNYRRLADLCVSDQRIAIYEEGLWSSTGQLKFEGGNKAICRVSEDGDAVINVTSIDEKLNGYPVSVIKMDIEGSELEALNGAADTIKRCRPRLAICVYHKPEDIIEIPSKILQLNPDYKLYLRHYSYVDTETVLYAI